MNAGGHYLSVQALDLCAQRGIQAFEPTPFLPQQLAYAGLLHVGESDPPLFGLADTVHGHISISSQSELR